MANGLIDQRGRDKVIMGILVILFTGLLILQMGISTLIIGNDFIEGVIDPDKLVLISIFGNILGLLNILLSVQLVVACRKSGFIAQIILNGVALCLITLDIIIFKHYLLISEYGMIFVTEIVCFLLNNLYTTLAGEVESIHKLAYTDDLTGLPNRKERLRAIEDIIQYSPATPVFTLISFDLDNFKNINDSLGHKIGDVYLTEIIHNLRNVIIAPDSIGRIGGDEFLVIVNGAKTDAEIEAYTAKIESVINKPFCFKEHDYRITASFGIARCPKDSDRSETLLKQVDIALTRAKAKGKNQLVFFDESMQIKLNRQLSIEHKLSESINRGELYVEYQPQYYIPNQELRGFEVLLRWTSPVLGRVAPLDFIPLAEENGSIVEIGRWIIQHSCTEFMKLSHLYEKHPILAINISVVQFRDPDFISSVKKAIEDSGINPNFVEFEITESVCISTPETTRAILRSLKEMGIKIALDDFGTGYSSLSYLRSLPFDLVKIDKSFIDTIGSIPDEKNIVKSIINMAHQLDLEVIAEGIERQEQYDYLVKANCDIIQGNLVSRPVPITAL
ncbi:MAG: bifunctional diguanylate cyclase/phosphodiesterase [Treponema sp.]|nr:bifunctional diguanylate cyclase/phosphodiesterase [Treponema sp.]